MHATEKLIDIHLKIKFEDLEVEQGAACSHYIPFQSVGGLSALQSSSLTMYLKGYDGDSTAMSRLWMPETGIRFVCKCSLDISLSNKTRNKILKISFFGKVASYNGEIKFKTSVYRSS